MESSTAVRVRPDYLAGGVDLLWAIGEVETEIEAALHFQGGVALNGHAVFADVDDLVEIEHGVLRFAGENGIGGRLNSMSHAAATVGWSRWQRRRYSNHGEGPNTFVLHINAGWRKSKQGRKRKK